MFLIRCLALNFTQTPIEKMRRVQEIEFAEPSFLFGRPKKNDPIRLRRLDRTMKICRWASFFSLAVINFLNYAEVFTLTGKNTETKYHKS